MDESSLDAECVCYICQDLLVENPESLYPTPAKRSKPNTADASQEPRPSTSAAATASSSSLSSLTTVSSNATSSSDDDTPELCSTPCGHIYHKYCLSSWIKKKRECPTCRCKVTPAKLTRIFLPLTPGQCRSCKTRIQQVENAQLERVLAQSHAEDCAEKEKHWRERCIELTQENEELKESLEAETDKVEELEAEVAAEQIGKKLLENHLRESEAQYRRKEQQCQQDVEVLQTHISELEKEKKDGKQEVEYLRKENCRLKTTLEEQKQEKQRCNVDEAPANANVHEMRELYRLSQLEKEKFRSDRNYEKARADWLQEQLKRLMDNSSGPMITVLPECVTGQVFSEISVVEEIHETTLATDLEVSDSDEDDHGNLGASETGATTMIEITNREEEISVITFTSSPSVSVLSLSESSESESESSDDESSSEDTESNEEESGEDNE